MYHYRVKIFLIIFQERFYKNILLRSFHYHKRFSPTGPGSFYLEPRTNLSFGPGFFFLFTLF